MTEDQLEQEVLSWLVKTGYRQVCGYDIEPDEADPWRNDFRQVLLLGPLCKATERLNPQAPREEAVYQNQNLGIPARFAGNRTFHALLHPAQIQVPAGQAGGSCTTGAAARRDGVGEVGVVGSVDRMRRAVFLRGRESGGERDYASHGLARESENSDRGISASAIEKAQAGWAFAWCA